MMVSLGLLVLRFVVGSLFALHGYPKIFGGPDKPIPPDVERVLGKGFVGSMKRGGLDNTAGFVASLGVPSPKPMAAALAATEFGGGLALILGWKTRLAALALLISQIVAVAKVHGKHGLIAEGGYEYNAALIAATAALVISGPGALALNRRGL